jgi:serine/threonine protein kinase
MGLKFLHGQKVVHRDIKPRNIIQTSQGWKFIDFDSAYKTGDPAPGPGGFTWPYVAPEVVCAPVDPIPQCNSDMFAFGIIMWEMLTGLQLAPIVSTHTDMACHW